MLFFCHNSFQLQLSLTYFPYSNNKFKIIIPTYYLIKCIRIRRNPFFRGIASPFCPLHLKAIETPFSFFNEVYLLAVISPPKVIAGSYRQIFLLFQPFHDQIIFPEQTHVISQFQGIKIIELGITNTVINKKIT